MVAADAATMAAAIPNLLRRSNQYSCVCNVLVLYEWERHIGDVFALVAGLTQIVHELRCARENGSLLSVSYCGEGNLWKKER